MSYTSKYTGKEIDELLDKAGNVEVSPANPIGSILPVMGTEAPQDYLICDGSELNIAEYSALANYFEKQFGSKNHFGGNGVSTFAVPDLRNEFLRGYGDRTEDIGIHQDATEHISFYSQVSTKQLQVRIDSTGVGYVEDNIDEEITQLPTSCINITGGSSHVDSATPLPSYYTSRPTNVAVLFCIKYTESAVASASGSSYREVELLETPTDFSMSTSSMKLYDQELTLNDDIANYDQIIINSSAESSAPLYIISQQDILSVNNIKYSSSDSYVDALSTGSCFTINVIWNGGTFSCASSMMYFKNGTTLVLGFIGQSGEALYEKFKINSIKGIKY